MFRMKPTYYIKFYSWYTAFKMSLFNIYSISLVIDYGTQYPDILNHSEYQ